MGLAATNPGRPVRELASAPKPAEPMLPAAGCKGDEADCCRLGAGLLCCCSDGLASATAAGASHQQLEEDANESFNRKHA